MSGDGMCQETCRHMSLLGDITSTTIAGLTTTSRTYLVALTMINGLPNEGSPL
jgi:hypothetical protein